MSTSPFDVNKLKGDLEAWEITAKRLEEAQIAEFAERSTADVLYWKGQAEAANIALAKVRKVRDGYADQAKFADVDPASYFREFVRRLDSACMAGVAEQSGAGAPETSVRCGAPAAAVSDMTKDRTSSSPEVPVDAIVNLTNHQEQCDMDGVMVKVSRQALCEVLLYVTEVRPDNKWASPVSSPDRTSK